MNNLKGMDENADKIKEYLEAEICEGGLLEDVEAIRVGPLSEDIPEPPYLWITEQPIVEDKERSQGGQRVYLKAPIEITAADFDFEDVEKSYKLSKNLASRVEATIEKHHKLDQSGWFRMIDFNELIPDGADIVEGSKRVSQSILIIDGIFRKDKICKKE